MPNWAIGELRIIGKKENLKAFVDAICNIDFNENEKSFTRAFVYDSLNGKEVDYFVKDGKKADEEQYRSVNYWMNWIAFFAEELKAEAEATGEISFEIWFAWYWTMEDHNVDGIGWQSLADDLDIEFHWMEDKDISENCHNHCYEPKPESVVPSK